MTTHQERLIVLTGGTGTTGRRIADRLRARNLTVRCASRAGGAIADGLAAPVAHALAGMFESVLDGRNAHLGPGVHEALGRPPRDFTTFAARASTGGAWTTAIAPDAR